MSKKRQRVLVGTQKKAILKIPNLIEIQLNSYERFLQKGRIDRGEELPLPVDGSVIYYAGPSPTKPGNVISSVGPTTSYRMDPYAPRLLDLGMRMMVGKGKRDQEVIDSCVKNKAVYCAAVGGAAALLAKSVTKVDIIAYEDLGPEAIRRLEVKDFPCIVVNDVRGNDLYKEGRKQYAK